MKSAEHVASTVEDVGRKRSGTCEEQDRNKRARTHVGTELADQRDTLIATAEGTVVRIFDADTFLLREKECNHIVTVKPVPDKFEINLDDATCSDCSTTMENWLCLVCHQIFCGRFQNRHMLGHFRDTGHCVSMSLIDLSVWCHGCEMYLNHDFFPKLHVFFVRMHQLKFREQPQNVMRSADDNALLFGEDIVQVDCEHIGQTSRDLEKIKSSSLPCETCALGEAGKSTPVSEQENWVCLTCLGVFCGRYNQKHMLQHYNTLGHSVCLSLVDFSTWCYECGQYVDYNLNPKSKAVFDHLSRLKFSGEQLPQEKVRP
mmetsp:Transcript_17663/g.29999  ORF Transcript_17663/g.29999 Transcript_17663/m.29999 type:complete len:316 (-) Transcript_17663:470-1417(-)|eukprot:CAMPEP_0203761954 /NCGR_PEP_ID=MMETSP0098-20131031/14937_1 /ASSEMBLY_ACC=CAM_ASM_000208 /TAXON_ID=96639 /ORGANISM=" , Strain NY0313808BC1" /LENGTH=315 /DNA_ID=CAMNT_0050656163 /DNA_START=334 /DNA_END=1281 /DNA_ORIENTATION=-